MLTVPVCLNLLFTVELSQRAALFDQTECLSCKCVQRLNICHIITSEKL